MNELSNSRVLITGGAGFVGSTTADLLLQEGVSEIILLDNMVRGTMKNIEPALASGVVRFVEGDIRDIDLVNRLMDGMDYCVHMAALRITHCAAEPREALTVMIDGTFNVMEACVKRGIRKLVAASSASIYGTADTFPTNERHHPYNNHTLYGAAKTANEQMLRSFCELYGLKYLAMRYFNVYGPRMDTHGKYTEVLIRWYNLIREGKRPLIFGDGKQTMDFVYIEDIARSNVLALSSDATDEALNVASGVETSLEELCFTLLEVMGSDLKPEYIPLPDERKKVEVYRRLADTGLALRLTGFRAGIGLKDGLARLTEWLKHNAAS